MRSLWISGLLVMMAGTPAWSGAADVETARLNAARAAMDAHIRLGDLARMRGDLKTAEAAYREALAVYRRASRGVARVPVARLPAPVRGTPVRAPRSEFREIPIPDTSPATAAQSRKNAVRVSEAIAAALNWLAANQDETGFWDSDRHEGGALYNVGVTGLALMAFFGAGYTDGDRGAAGSHATTIRKGLGALVVNQADDGCIGTRATHSFFYNHCIATAALCEAYGLTKSAKYKRAAQQAIDFVAKSRNPYMAWRYVPRGGENDTSVTAWAVIALTSAKNAGLSIDEAALAGARTWIDKMTNPKTGRVGYIYQGSPPARPESAIDSFPADRSEAMTAAGLVIRACTGGLTAKDEVVRRGASLFFRHTPAWNEEDGSVDMYYWLFGTMAMYRLGGKHWRAWAARVTNAVLEGRHSEKGDRFGSWDPVGAWGNDGGRVYATAAMAMTLEIVNRYDRAFTGPRPEKANADKAD